MKLKSNFRHRRGLSLLLAIIMIISLFAMQVASVYAASSVKENNLIKNGSFENSEEPSSTLNAWTLSEGFSISDSSAAEGKYSLTYSGKTEATAISDKFNVTENEDYILIAKIKRESTTDIAKVSIEGFDVEIESTDVGTWTKYEKRFNSSNNSSLNVKITAKGNVAFDKIIVAKTYTEEEIECVVNGSFDEEGGWASGIPLKDVTSIGGDGNALGVAITSQGVSVDDNTWYLYTADIYRDNAITWKYMDMYPTDENLRLRGYKVNEWEHLGALWYSDKKTYTTIRSVVEQGWDNVSVSSSSDISNSYVDNISLKKVTVSDELISDPNFSSNGWKIVSNGTISTVDYDGIGGTLASTMNNASDGKTVALANNGNTIPVEKNTTYVLSAWVRIDGSTRTLKTVLDMNDIDDELQIESTTYNHNSKGNYYTLISGV